MHSLQKITNYLNTLSVRERVMASLVLIAVIYALFDAFVFTKLDREYQQLQTQKQELSENKLLQSDKFLENATLLAQKKRGIEQLKQEIDSAQHLLEKTESQLDAVLGQLVPPTKITELLRNLLLKTNDLKLISLNNEPVKEILLTENSETDEQQPLLYEHATVIKLTGNYQQLYRYLHSLEESDWGLFWDTMHYTVTDYPQAEISLRVHTISTNKYWIGL